MTEPLRRAMEKLEGLPPDLQDEIARTVSTYADEDRPPVDLTQEEEDAVLRSRAAAARGAFATDERMGTIWAKHGL